MNKWFAIAVALAGCGTDAGPELSASPSFEVADHRATTGETDTDEPYTAPVQVVTTEETSTFDTPGGEPEPTAEESDTEAIASTEPPAEPAVPVHTFALRRGESLHHFARWSEQPIEQIAALSDLALDGSYEVGTEVRVELNPDDRSQVEARRDAHHQTRAQAYLDSRGPHSTGFYTVKTGDTAWQIAQSTEAVPVWLIESMNPSVDLERLRPGVELLVPVFQDVTASLDED